MMAAVAVGGGGGSRFLTPLSEQPFASLVTITPGIIVIS